MKFLIFVMLFTGIGLFGASGYVWYDRMFTNPERIFYGMLDKNLTTDSITRTIGQKEGTQSVSQTYFMSFSPGTGVESVSKVEQVGQNREISSVTTNTIGFKDTDYVKYSDINVPVSDGGKGDYSKVLNQWGKRDNNSQAGKPQFLNEALFTFIPFGNFSSENRADIVSLIKERKAYKIQGSDISYQEGRPVATMRISISPKALVEVLREYAVKSGVGDLELLDPSQYEKAADVGIDIKIDVMSRHLESITFPGQGRTETYSAYGLNRAIEVPAQTISVEELQSRLQE